MIVSEKEHLGSKVTLLQLPTLSNQTQKKIPKLLKPWQNNKLPIKYSQSCSLLILLHWLNSRPAGHQANKHERTTNTLTLHEYSAAWREVHRGNVTRWHAPWKRSQNPGSLALRYIHFRQISSCASEFARQPMLGVLCWPSSGQLPWALSVENHDSWFWWDLALITCQAQFHHYT